MKYGHNSFNMTKNSPQSFWEDYPPHRLSPCWKLGPHSIAHPVAAVTHLVFTNLQTETRRTNDLCRKKRKKKKKEHVVKCFRAKETKKKTKNCLSHDTQANKSGISPSGATKQRRDYSKCQTWLIQTIKHFFFVMDNKPKFLFLK